MTNSSVQNAINAAATKLSNAFTNFKVAKQSLKDLKKSLKERLELLPEYQDLMRKRKELKESRKSISEELKDINREADALAMDTDEHKEINDFIEDEDLKFSEVKEKTLMQLSRDLVDGGVEAEVYYKNGQLILIVARSSSI